jgi:general secretion pathway protein C
VLETLFRKRFYLVHLALTAILAVVLARVTTSIAARVLVEKVVQKFESSSSQSASKSVVRAPSSPPRDFVGLANANIFEGRRELALDEPITQAAPSGSMDVGDWRSAPRSSLKLRLVGTMAFSEPTLSLCSIVEEGANAKGAELYSINPCAELDISGLSPEDQKLVGKPAPCSKVADVAIVKRIEPEVVYIWNVADTRIEYLALNEPPAPAGAQKVAAKADTPEKTEDSSDGIVKTGDNRFGVPRSTVDNALNNLSQLATEARVVPAFEGGKPVGFKLFSIKPGSLYSKIGLQNGDVINRINGYEMSSPEKGLEVYQKLKDSANITVDIKRRGKGMTLDYTIQ